MSRAHCFAHESHHEGTKINHEDTMSTKATKEKHVSKLIRLARPATQACLSGAQVERGCCKSACPKGNVSMEQRLNASMRSSCPSCSSCLRGKPSSCLRVIFVASWFLSEAE